MKRMIGAIKPFVPNFMKRGIRQVPQLYRRSTAQMRLLPDFLIIGGQRCGTTSLYNYLVKHPCIASARRKEVHFFDLSFRKGLTWYRSHFPSVLYKYYRKNLITGEATPYYMFHPSVPERIFGMLPKVKLIALLRNPADRAYSHYFHSVRRGYETLSFEDAITSEMERLSGASKKIVKNEDDASFSHQHHSYLSRGIYLDQLKVWMGLFPKEQILILKSEDLYTDPSTIFKQATEFLGLPHWELKAYEKFQSGKYPEIETHLKKRLVNFFEPHNQRLYQDLGMGFDWH